MTSLKAKSSIVSEQGGRLERATTVARWGVIMLALLVGGVSLRYVAGDSSLAPRPLRPNMDQNPAWFVLHAVSASLALLVGPWQFSRRLRQFRPRLHRYGGHLYIACCGVAGLTAFPIALGTFAGPIAGAGFATLGVAWLLTSSMGYVSIRQGHVAAHRRWMVRSMALALAAVTLRFYLPVLPLLGIDFTAGYRAITWLSWVPNLVVAEILLASGFHATRNSVQPTAAETE